MATFAFKALDLAGSPTKGEIEADDKQAVAAQLRSQGPDRRRHRGAGTPPSAGDLLARFKQVKADELVIATRQLSTMVQLGHVAAARALRDRGADRERQAARRLDRRCARTSRRASRSPTRCASTPTSSTTSTWRWSQAGETGGILDQTLVRVADQLEKDAALRRQIKAAMIYPSLIGGFALVVLVALVAFLVPVFEKIFEDFGGDLPAITKFTVWLSHMVTGRWYVMIAVTVGRGLGVPPLEELRARAHAVGPVQAEVPDEDRRHRPEGRAGALLAHLLGPDRRRRADARGDRHHRPDLRQPGRREGDGGRARVGQEGRHAHRADDRRCPRPSR